jgi:sphingomyelin phosphodiesterase
MWLFSFLFALAASRLSGVEDFLACEACKFTVKKLQSLVEEPNLIYTAEDLIIDACSLKLARDVCEGAIREMGSIVVDSLAEHYLDPEFACVKLDICSSPKYRVENLTEWMEQVLADKPALPLPQVNSTERFKFAHITDLHFDLEYIPGSNTNCGKPLCCRDGVGTAGPWGDYNCDVPYQTMEAALRQLATFEPEFIMWTGDTPPHNVWNQSYEYNGHYITEGVKLVREVFPDIKVYPALGNHGCFPVNVYQFGNETYLNNLLADLWEPWIGVEGAKTVRETGSYSVLHPGTNLRVIHVNTQACNNRNFHLFANVTDPGALIEWLRAELYAAEKNGEVVYILGHIYGSSCLTTWAYHYATLIDRFQHIIRSQFYGHTHGDMMELNRGVFSGEPTGLMLMPGAITTYTNKNPSFRIVEANPDTFLLTNYYQYRLDLGEANRLNSAVWKFAYDPLTAYNLTDLSPKSILDMSNRMLDDEALAVAYRTNEGTGTPGQATTCDAGCRKSTQCHIAWGVDQDQYKCSGGKPSFKDREVELLFGSWIYKDSK